MTLPLRWRVACAVSSLLAVATLATPADGAPVVTVVTLTDATGDTSPTANFGQADILRTKAAAPGFDYVVHYYAVNRSIKGAVYAGNDDLRERALCEATMATYSGKT